MIVVTRATPAAVVSVLAAVAGLAAKRVGALVGAAAEREVEAAEVVTVGAGAEKVNRFKYLQRPCQRSPVHTAGFSNRRNLHASKLGHGWEALLPGRQNPDPTPSKEGTT
jgi:hypothetical protein